MDMRGSACGMAFGVRYSHSLARALMRDGSWMCLASTSRRQAGSCEAMLESANQLSTWTSAVRAIV